MHEILTEIVIRASVERVWKALTDFASYREWNPIIRSIDGAVAEGAALQIHLQPHALEQSTRGALCTLQAFGFRSWWALHGMRIPVRVLKLAPEQELRWMGTLALPNLFAGEHYFRMTTSGEGRVLLSQGERYGGLLEPAFRRAMEAINRPAMNAVNHALKRRLDG